VIISIFPLDIDSNFIAYMTWTGSRRVNEGVMEVAGSTVCFFPTIWYGLHLLNKVFNIHLIGFLLRATNPE